MLIDKEWYWDNNNVVALKQDLQVSQLEAAYITFNDDDDVALVRAKFEEFGIEDNFNWVVVNSDKVSELSKVPNHGCMPLATTVINDVVMIIFDAPYLNASEIGMPFDAMIAHEMVHVKQFSNKELEIRGDVFIWHGGRVPVEYNVKDTHVMFADGFSIAHQYALPWEAEAYDAELDYAISTERRNTILVAKELAKFVGAGLPEAGGDGYAVYNPHVRHMVLWLEFTLNILMRNGYTLETAGVAISIGTDKDPISVVNACKEILKARASKKANMFDSACRFMPM